MRRVEWELGLLYKMRKDCFFLKKINLKNKKIVYYLRMQEIKFPVYSNSDFHYCRTRILDLYVGEKASTEAVFLEFLNISWKKH